MLYTNVVFFMHSCTSMRRCVNSLCFCAFVRQVEQETALLKETIENAANVLSEAAATTARATDAAKQASATHVRAHRSFVHCLRNSVVAVFFSPCNAQGWV